MRGINKVIVSGNVSEDVQFIQTSGSKEQTLCTFFIASDRHTQGHVVTAWVKVNVYIDALVKLCKARMHKGVYVLVEGELMSRGEVRARELIFLSTTGREDESEAGVG